MKVKKHKLFRRLNRKLPNDVTVAEERKENSSNNNKEHEKKQIDVNPFPIDCVKGVAREFGDVYSAVLESPPQFWIFCFLTCLGLLVADWASLASALVVQPRLYVILLGLSAKDRKSTPITLTVQFFHDLFPKDFSACEGVGSAEGLALYLVDNPKTLLTLDEFKTLIVKGGIKGSVLLPCVGSLFDKNSYASYTKTSQIEISGAYLSMLAASTEETFLSIWNSSSLDLGLLNRLFLVCGKATRKDGIPPEIPDHKLIPIREQLKSLVERIKQETPRFQMTKKAKETFDHWYQSMPDSVASDRLDSYFMRLLTLFALNEDKKIIKSELVERVLKIINWELRGREQYQPFVAETKIAKVEESIRRQLTKHGALSKSDLKAGVHYKRYGVTLYKRGLDNLIKAKEVFFDQAKRVYVLL